MAHVRIELLFKFNSLSIFAPLIMVFFSQILLSSLIYSTEFEIYLQFSESQSTTENFLLSSLWKSECYGNSSVHLWIPIPKRYEEKGHMTLPHQFFIKINGYDKFRNFHAKFGDWIPQFSISETEFVITGACWLLKWYTGATSSQHSIRSKRHFEAKSYELLSKTKANERSTTCLSSFDVIHICLSDHNYLSNSRVWSWIFLNYFQRHAVATIEIKLTAELGPRFITSDMQTEQFMEEKNVKRYFQEHLFKTINLMSISHSHAIIYMLKPPTCNKLHSYHIH